jgi:hypothetical protein
MDAFLSVFDSLVDIANIDQGGFFLRKKPLCIVHSVKNRIENAVAARPVPIAEAQYGSLSHHARHPLVLSPLASGEPSL